MKQRVVTVMSHLLLLFLAATSTSGTIRNEKFDSTPVQIADIVLLNGQIITVDAKDSIAQAVAIAAGKIVAVGSNDAMKSRIGASTRVIDLHGRTATPGLIDTHLHFDGTSLLYELDLSYPAVKSINDVLTKIREQVAKLKPGEWVRGRGWDEGKLAELRYIYASDLDRVSPNNPVYLTHTTGHYATTNSYALKLAGVTKDTANPRAGTIDRLADGTPSGVLKEGATGLVGRLVPRFTAEQQRNGLAKMVEELNKEGMTAVKDPQISTAKWDLYKELLGQDKLTVRAFILWQQPRSIEAAQQLIDRVASFTKPYQSTGDGRLISGGVKIHLDGSGGARTAWMYQDWNKNFKEKDTGNVGYPTMEPETFRQMVRLFHQAGIHVSTHAIGDRGIDWTIDTYAEVLKEKPTRGLRHAISHCNTPTDHAINLMAELQKKYDAGYPEAQSTFMWWLGDNYAGNLGPERSLRLMPFKTYLSKGILWGGGSDYSVTPFAARYGIWASIARKPLQGSYGANPFGSAESIDVHHALRSYTSWAARQLFLEDKIGSIEVGKEADIAVWDRDLYRVPTDQIKEMKCELTLFSGRIVYQAAGSPITIR